MATDLKVLPLEKAHIELGAKFAPFAGWNMPVRYQTSIAEEHMAVRNAAGIFDVSHMGQLFFSGKSSEEFLEKVFTNTIKDLKIGKARYGFLLNPHGGVIDDVIVYRLADDEYFLCVNASNTETVVLHLKAEIERLNISPEAMIFRDASGEYSQFAVQGPSAPSLLLEIFPEFSNYSMFSCGVVSGESKKYSEGANPCILARTGYTGEDGAEIFISKAKAQVFWDDLFSIAKEKAKQLLPCGLAARDTLRLEAAFPLHGHELRIDQTPLNAGLERFVNMEKEDFVGKYALEHQLSLGVSPKLVGLRVLGKGIVREELSIVKNGRTVGWSTSGTKTPLIEYPIAMGYILSEHSVSGNKFEVDIRGRQVEVEVVKLPFYKRKRDEKI